jgi:hypothetical protein
MYPKSTKQGQFLKFLNISENLHGRFWTDKYFNLSELIIRL